MVGNLTENPTNCAVAAQHVSRGDKARLELPPLAVAGPRETGEMPRHPCTFHRMRTENQMRAATEKPSPPPFRSVRVPPVRCPGLIRHRRFGNLTGSRSEISAEISGCYHAVHTQKAGLACPDPVRRERLVSPLRLRRPKLHASTLRCARICYRLDRPTSRTFYQQGRGIIHRVYPRASIYLSASY